MFLARFQWYRKWRGGGDFNKVINARERIKTLKGWQ